MTKVFSCIPTIQFQQLRSFLKLRLICFTSFVPPQISAILINPSGLIHVKQTDREVPK